MTDTAPITDFAQLGLSEETLACLSFTTPTAIQAQILPHTLAGFDAIGQAQTGTGKTMAFLLTILHALEKHPFTPDEIRYVGEPRALVLAPTRELAQQIFKDCESINSGCFYNLCLTGGSNAAQQAKAINQRPLDIVIGTPGRILDWLTRGILFVDRVEILVLDEADRMLDMGFIVAIKQIVAKLPANTQRQSLLFSATFNADVLNLAHRWLYKPVMVSVTSSQTTNIDITERFYLLSEAQKMAALLALLHQQPPNDKVIVFANSKHQVNKLVTYLAHHFPKNTVVALSGDIAQDRRERHLAAFQAGMATVLVATDVAGRGIHVDDVALVINYNLPDSPDDYVHRIGRTGRAGRAGVAISLIDENDAFNVTALEQHLKKRLVLTQFELES